MSENREDRGDSESMDQKFLRAMKMMDKDIKVQLPDGTIEDDWRIKGISKRLGTVEVKKLSPDSEGMITKEIPLEIFLDWQ